MKKTCIPLLAGSLLLAACAHGPEPAATLPEVSLTDSFESAGPPPVTDPEPVDWARSNALVGALGGHAGHLRGAAAPASAPEGKP